MNVRLTPSQVTYILKRKNAFGRIFVEHLHTAAPSSKPLPISESSLNVQTPYNICFLRHGQSTWNRDNRFIGWTGETKLVIVGHFCSFQPAKLLSKKMHKDSHSIHPRHWNSCKHTDTSSPLHSFLPSPFLCSQHTQTRP